MGAIIAVDDVVGVGVPVGRGVVVLDKTATLDNGVANCTGEQEVRKRVKSINHETEVCIRFGSEYYKTGSAAHRPRAELPGGSGTGPLTIAHPGGQGTMRLCARQPGQQKRVVRQP